MKQYFMDGEELPEDIAEAVTSLNNDILDGALKNGDMSKLIDIKFVVCVEA